MASKPDKPHSNPADSGVSPAVPGDAGGPTSPASRPYRPAGAQGDTAARRGASADGANANWSATLGCAVREYPLCSLASAFVCGALVGRLLR